MKEDILPVEAIQERDVDLILLEEFSTDNTFCEWFISELQLPKIVYNLGAWRSITDYGLGETDVLFSYQSEKDRVYVMIENKLDASFQDNQADRYLERASKYIEDGLCDSTYTVLVAPGLYCENQNEFESFVTYEQVSDWLASVGSKRSLFKARLIQIASEKLRRGYQPVNSESVQAFWFSYWKYKEQRFPEFQMKEPKIVPHNSDWPLITIKELPDIKFRHKLKQGNVDATFHGFVGDLEFRLKEDLPAEFQLEKHNSNFSIRVFSGEIDRTKDFLTQEKLVAKGLENMKAIVNWLLSYVPLNEYYLHR